MLEHIRNKDRLVQVLDYGGLRFGTIRPTDIDAVIEYKNKAYVIIEAKKSGAELPYGQRLCLERMANDLSKDKKKEALIVVTEHDAHDSKDVIGLAECAVREIYFSSERKWRQPKKPMDVREICSLFLGRFQI